MSLAIEIKNPEILRSPPASLNKEQYSIKILVSGEDKMMAYHLRHRVFCQELRWVPCKENGLEIDTYDSHAVSFGVFNESELLACLRVIMPETPFMLENEFLSLAEGGYNIRKESDTAELSRLSVATEARCIRVSGYSISVLLLKGLYHWCLNNNIRYLYAVTEQKIHRLFCAKGFPWKLIGKPTTMPDGVVATAIILDWRKFETLNAALRPKLLRWFTQGQLFPAQEQLQQPESCLQHQVFA